MEPSGSCPPGAGRSVALFGFDDERFPSLVERTEALLRASGYAVKRSPLAALWDPASRPQTDVSLALVGIYPHVRSNATARRLTQLYFGITVLDSWILPILQATSLWRSEATLEAELAVADPLTGKILWKGGSSLTIREKPTGFPGPGTEEFSRMMLDRAGANLAVAIFEQACAAFPRVARSESDAS